MSSDHAIQITEQQLVWYLMFGSLVEVAEPSGGLMSVLDLDALHVIEDSDEAEYPTGLFLAWRTLDERRASAYGRQDAGYESVEEDPEDPNGCRLRFANGRPVRIRISVHAPRDTHTPEEVWQQATAARNWVVGIARQQMLLLGIDAPLVDPGPLRNATTILNESVKTVCSFEVEYVLGETFTVPIGTFDTVTFTQTEGAGTPAEEEREEEEITL